MGKLSDIYSINIFPVGEHGVRVFCYRKLKIPVKKRPKKEERHNKKYYSNTKPIKKAYQVRKI